MYRLISGKLSQRAFIRLFQKQHPHMMLLERSRFNRRLHQLLHIVKLIRNKLRDNTKNLGDKGIVDSFPIPIYKPNRSFRVSIFRDYADIGFNATKNLDSMDLKHM